MSFDAPLPSYNASDPHATYLNVSCLDLLLIEMVPLAERMARRDERGEVETDAGLGERKGKEKGNREKDAEISSVGGGGGGDGDTTEVYKDAMFFRLDGLGYRVGQGLSERFSRDRPRFIDNLDVIKFVCKDLWTILFKKQIDNLKTNHRGIYVLTDNTFRPFMRMSMSNRAEAVARAQPYLHFPAGLLRGALQSLGIHATVQAESTDLPQAVFQIKTITAKP